MSQNTFNEITSNDTSSFPARLLALSTLQILANATEFTSIRSVSLSTLTHVASRYLELLGAAARANADFCSRNQLNGWDISGVLESLHGPGALSELHNWCIDHADRYSDMTKNNHHRPNQADDSNVQVDEVDKLAHMANHLDEYRLNTPVQPITSLSFLPLTAAEVAALDRAGESDVEDDHPSPLASSTSGSSEDDSDTDLVPISLEAHSSSSPAAPHDIPSGVELEKFKEMQLDITTTEDQPLSYRWRSIKDIPVYVPPYLPPFPGLERVDDPPIGGEKEPEHRIEEKSRDPSPSEQLATNTQDPYVSAIPFPKSQLHEFHGPFLAPQNSLSPTSPNTTTKKRRLNNGSLDGFLQTYNFLLEEKKTNKAADEKRFLKPNPSRLQLIASQQTPALHDSMFGGIPIGSIRTNRWSAGWIPHPPLKDGQPLPVPELKPYGYTALPIPVTMPVPIQFPPNSLVNQPHQRIPGLIPRLFQKISEQPRGDCFTIVNRMTRLAPPSGLGDSGEALPYRIQATNHQSHLNNSNETDLTNLNGPKYMDWGFHWPSHHGADDLPPARTPSDFKPIEFPGMPKTTAEKNRISQMQKRLENSTGDLLLEEDINKNQSSHVDAVMDLSNS